MARQHTYIQLKEDEETVLRKLVSQGKNSARVQNRGRILLMNHEGQKLSDISTLLGISYATVTGVIQSYKFDGLNQALNDESRSGAPRKITSELEAYVTAVACSKAPEGLVRWTIELIRDEVVRLKVVESLSISSTHTILKKANSSLGSTSFGV